MAGPCALTASSGPRLLLSRRRRPSVPLASAASAAHDMTLLLSPAYATTGAPGSPRLVNRALRMNPMSTLVDLASARLASVDLGFAAAVDRRRWAAAFAAATGLVLGLVSSSAAGASSQTWEREEDGERMVLLNRGRGRGGAAVLQGGVPRACGPLSRGVQRGGNGGTYR